MRPNTCRNSNATSMQWMSLLLFPSSMLVVLTISLARRPLFPPPHPSFLFFSFPATVIRAQVSKFHRIRWIIQLSCERPWSASAGPCNSSFINGTSNIERDTSVVSSAKSKVARGWRQTDQSSNRIKGTPKKWNEVNSLRSMRWHYIFRRICHIKGKFKRKRKYTDCF